MTMKHFEFRQYKLDHLNCADCANKMEQKIQKLTYVSEVHLNYMTQRLKVGIKQSVDAGKMQSEIEKIVTDIEHEVQVTEIPESENLFEKLGNHPDNNDGEQHYDESQSLKIIIISGVFFVIPWLINFQAPVSIGVYLAAYLVAGGPVLKRAFTNLLKGRIFDENFLMSIATLGAFAIGEHPEGVAVMLFYQVGEYFQGKAVNRSRKSVASLMNIRPEYASLITVQGEERVDPSVVEPGQHILVRPGEKIPLDGHVLSGIGMVDTSALTGESLPRDVKPGSEVLSGSINQTGVLTIHVDKKYGDSAVSKILELVQNASAKKAKTEKFITRFARYYTPVVVGIAAGITLIPPLLIPEARFSEWFYRALIFLVISCPCALVISIPLGFFGGIGGASRAGILVKGGNYLEALKDVDTIIFDKTGTLTQGIFRVEEIYAAESFSKEEILMKMATAEYYSNHPIAESIRSAYGDTIDESIIDEYQELPGRGIISSISGHQIMIGKKEFLEEYSIETAECFEPGTVVHISIDKKYAGYVVIRDQVKAEAAKAISELKESGINRVIMLTGDQKSIADQIAEKLGIDEVYANLLPHDKVRVTEEIMEKNSGKGKIMVVGDGVNDAPVLARADIGVSMGGLGSDAAIEASDVVIMTDQLSSIIKAFSIAKKTHGVVWQNIVAALGVKALVMILGAFGMASIWEAVFADVGVALLAILNAMRVIES
ncbi:MAG: cadmium-translocating P-type ATPase [Tindallia sp. MSAO_Bac2]|nr:MAG: cadmium-translocating P-type ATPase [Tindallia sp. MSAO_Bac2]